MLNFRSVPNMPVPGMLAWRAVNDGYSFVITYEPRTGPGYEGWTGYTASWKNQHGDIRPHGLQPANRIGGTYASLLAAQAACDVVWRQKLASKYLTGGAGRGWVDLPRSR